MSAVPRETYDRDGNVRVQQGFGGADKFETRLLIPSKMGGAVIGKKGCNIQQLRSDYNATIRVPDAPGPERIMSVTCEDLEGCCCVIDAAIPYMYEQQEEDDGSPKEIRVLVNQGIVGGIIGKGGAKIKEIRESSGANIKAYQSCAPQSTDRVIALKGPRESLVPALRMCLEVVQDNVDRVQRGIQYDPANFDAFYGDEYGGWGAGGGSGSGGRQGYAGRGGAPPLPPGRGGYGGPGGFQGEGEGFGGGFNAGRGGGGYGGGGRGGAPDYGGGFGGGDAGGFGQGFGGAGRNGGGEGFGGASQGFGGGFGAPASPGDEGPRETQQVTIPKSMGGAIIGPGGQRIRKIRTDSKAGITIGEANENDERVITIEGTAKQIQTAQYLLQQAVKEHQGPRESFRSAF